MNEAMAAGAAAAAAVAMKIILFYPKSASTTERSCVRVCVSECGVFAMGVSSSRRGL